MIGITAVLSAASAETLLRFSGRRPWESMISFPNEPVLHEFDPVLGWKPKPGSYVFPGYVTGSPPIRFTIWPDGSRATGARPEERDARVILVGDSFTEGWAISDEETFGWKLQERFPEVAVQNLGTAGYSTYQSLLRLERALKARDPRPLAVLYGFLDAHELRNVADETWRRLLAQSARRGLVFLPYCLLAPAGGLERHASEPYPVWPLREVSATVNTLAEAYGQFRSRERKRQARRVTDLLLDRMAHTSRLHDAKFFVVLLGNMLQRAHYVPYLVARGVSYIDCDYPWTLDTMVLGEGHPNGRRHSEWAECIGARLRSELPQ